MHINLYVLAFSLLIHISGVVAKERGAGWLEPLPPPTLRAYTYNQYDQTHFLWFANHVSNGRNHCILCAPDQINKIDSWLGDQIPICSNYLCCHPTYKNKRATDSCFALSGAHQCGVLMISAVCLLDDYGGNTGGRNRTLVPLVMDQSWSGQSGLCKHGLVRFV